MAKLGRRTPFKPKLSLFNLFRAGGQFNQTVIDSLSFVQTVNFAGPKPESNSDNLIFSQSISLLKSLHKQLTQTLTFNEVLSELVGSVTATPTITVDSSTGNTSYSGSIPLVPINGTAGSTDSTVFIVTLDSGTTLSTVTVGKSLIRISD